MASQTEAEETHPFDHSAQVAEQLTMLSELLWGVAGRHARLSWPKVRSLADAVQTREQRFRELLAHEDEEVRTIARSAADCARIANDIEVSLAEADIPFL